MQQAVQCHSATDASASVGNSNDLAAPARRGMLTALALLPLAAVTGAVLVADPALAAVARVHAVDAACPLDELGPEAEARWGVASGAARTAAVRTRATTLKGLAAKLGLVEVGGNADSDRMLTAVIMELRNWA